MPMFKQSGTLAAKQHLILKDPKIPDATAIKMVKPLTQEQARLTKCLHLDPTPQLLTKRMREWPKVG